MADKQQQPPPQPPKYRSLASREKRPSPFGTTLFVGLRAADAILQYHLLRHNWAHDTIRALHGVPITRVSAGGGGGGGGLLGLTPYGTIISALALGSSLKQIIFTTIISEQEMQPGPALAIAAFNTVFNTANTLLSVWTFSSVAPTTPTHIPPPIPPPPRRHSASTVVDTVLFASSSSSSPALLAGIVLYAAGMVLELGSEVQRKRFKAKPENQGKPYDGGGLWAWATHVNYGGYTLWRAGYAMAAAGPLWGLLVGGVFLWDFRRRAVPELDGYCERK
ncbi:MAG: hypothetical protein Q9177_003091, partial [Variospora cf. flavescens]